MGPRVTKPNGAGSTKQVGSHEQGPMGKCLFGGQSGAHKKGWKGVPSIRLIVTCYCFGAFIPFIPLVRWKVVVRRGQEGELVTAANLIYLTGVPGHRGSPGPDALTLFGVGAGLRQREKQDEGEIFEFTIELEKGDDVQEKEGRKEPNRCGGLRSMNRPGPCPASLSPFPPLPLPSFLPSSPLPPSCSPLQERGGGWGGLWLSG